MPSIGLQDTPTVARRRLIHELPSVELQSTEVLIAYPHMDVWRFEGILPCVYYETELTFLRNSRHIPLGISRKVLCIINDTMSIRKLAPFISCSPNERMEGTHPLSTRERFKSPMDRALCEAGSTWWACHTPWFDTKGPSRKYIPKAAHEAEPKLNPNHPLDFPQT